MQQCRKLRSPDARKLLLSVPCFAVDRLEARHFSLEVTRNPHRVPNEMVNDPVEMMRVRLLAAGDGARFRGVPGRQHRRGTDGHRLRLMRRPVLPPPLGETGQSAGTVIPTMTTQPRRHPEILKILELFSFCYLLQLRNLRVFE